LIRSASAISARAGPHQRGTSGQAEAEQFRDQLRAAPPDAAAKVRTRFASLAVEVVHQGPGLLVGRVAVAVHDPGELVEQVLDWSAAKTFDDEASPTEISPTAAAGRPPS